MTEQPPIAQLAADIITAVDSRHEKRLIRALEAVSEDQAVGVVVCLATVAGHALRDLGGRQWREYLDEALKEVQP